ncbi:hypothetical protein COBT_002105 [Conglomerata obtusa]
MHVNCSKAELYFNKEDEYLNCTHQKIQIPFYTQIKKLDNSYNLNNKIYTETYKKFENSQHIVISYDEISQKGVRDLILKIKVLLPEKHNGYSYKIHADLNPFDYNNVQTEKFHKFFLNFFHIFLDNEKYFGNTDDLEYCQYDAKIISHRNSHIDKLEKILKMQARNKYIIMDECCNNDKISYEVMFKLLFCCFLHKPVHSNILILCLNNIKDKNTETFESSLLQIFECKDFKCKNIFFTKLNCIDNEYKIKMRSSLLAKENDIPIESFVDVVEFNNDLLYKMFPCSINSHYDFMFGRFDDDATDPNYFKCIDDVTKMRFICCVYTIKNLNSSYKIYIERKYTRNMCTHYLNLRIRTKDNIFCEYQKDLGEFDYEFKARPIEHKKSYANNKAPIFLNKIYKYIDKNLQYNPFFAEFSPLDLYNLKGDVKIRMKRGVSYRIQAKYNFMLRKLSENINMNPIFGSETLYAELPSVKIVDYIENENYDFFPYDEDVYKKNELQLKWGKFTDLDISKTSELLNNWLILQVNCKNYIDYTYYIKIRTENSICHVDYGFCKERTLYQEECQLFVKTNIAYIKNEKSFTNYTPDELISLLQGMSTLMFENYTNLDHFICMNNLTYRTKYIIQIVHLYFLNVLSYNLNFDNSEILEKTSENLKFSDLVKKIRNNYQKNAYRIDINNIKYIEFLNDFLLPVQNLYKNKNLIDLDAEMFAILFKKYYNSIFDRIFFKFHKEKINFEISIITPNIMPCNEIEKIKKILHEKFISELN